MGYPNGSKCLLPNPTLSLCVSFGLWGALCFSGCTTTQATRSRVIPSVFRSSAATMPPPLVSVRASSDSVDSSAPLDPGATVEAWIRARGIRVGTDGTTFALYAFAKHSRRLVDPSGARAGDLVFFDMGAGRCGEHVGLVESADPGGRIAFRDVRGGQVQRGYAHAALPAVRRSPDGLILNTFLRSKRPDDPANARYFAGELLCGVGRLR